jgi:hypothetical protein
LWKYDVAEFFLAGDAEDYLEFNLAPNGAWWSCFFVSPRQAGQRGSLVGVETLSWLTPESWRVRAMIPLSEIPWPVVEWRVNVTFILESPNQRFLSLADLGGGNPDFHRPEGFLPMSLFKIGGSKHA